MYLKRVPPKSLPKPHFAKISSREEAARKDPAVHVSLSSYSLFKQPGTEVIPLPARPEAVEARRIRERSDAVSLFQ